MAATTIIVITVILLLGYMTMLIDKYSRKRKRIDPDVDNFPDFLKNRAVRVFIYLLAITGLITAGCWLVILGGMLWEYY